MNWLLFLLIGLAAGWLAGRITKGKGFGLIGNLQIPVFFPERRLWEKRNP